MTAINGIDVSVWQGEIDWARVKAGGVGFAMVRAGYGLAADPNFARNMEGAAAQGIPVGAYLYSRAVTTGEAEEEAVFLLELAKPYQIVYPASLDMESAGQHALTNNQRTGLALAFCGKVAQGGLTPGVYSSLYWFETMLDLPELKPVQRWVADWSSQKPSLEGGVDLWQHSSRGLVDGISGYVDLDVSFRDYAAEDGGGTPAA